MQKNTAVISVGVCSFRTVGSKRLDLSVLVIGLQKMKGLCLGRPWGLDRLGPSYRPLVLNITRLQMPLIRLQAPLENAKF